MKRIVTVILILNFWALVCNGQDNLKKVAIINPDGKNVSDELKTILREELSSIVVNTSGYTVLEREEVNKVVKARRSEVNIEFSESELREIGKFLQADYVCYAIITPIDNNYHISIKISEIETAKIVFQNTGITKNGTGDFIEVSRKTANNMLNNKTEEPTELLKAVVEDSGDNYWVNCPYCGEYKLMKKGSYISGEKYKCLKCGKLWIFPDLSNSGNNQNRPLREMTPRK
ncbi:MAG: hypothetical protein WCM76_16575 [Bacteroidota bacterium]